MVKDSRTAIRAHRLRPLAGPRDLHVETDEAGAPLRVLFEGVLREVASVQDRWRIDDEWWRETPLSRMYYQLRLEGDRVVTVYQDLVGGADGEVAWCVQRY